jgi:hypothetical protein
MPVDFLPTVASGLPRLLVLPRSNVLTLEDTTFVAGVTPQIDGAVLSSAVVVGKCRVLLVEQIEDQPNEEPVE